MVKEGGWKSEAFSLAKTENLFEVFKSCVLLLIFSCETFLGNMNFCFPIVLRNNSDFPTKSELMYFWSYSLPLERVWSVNDVT